MNIKTNSKSTNLQAFLNLMKGFIGSGILGMPFAFRLSGLWMGLVAMIFLSIVTVHCIFLLIESQDEIGRKKREKLMNNIESKISLEDEDKQKNDNDNQSEKSDTDKKSQKENNDLESLNLLSTIDTSNIDVFEINNEVDQTYLNPTTYGEVGENALTIIGRLLIEALLIFTQCGFCIAYLIFISTTMHDMFHEIVPFFREWVYIFITGILVLPFAMIQNIKYLTPISVVSELMLFAGMILVVYFDIVSFKIDIIKESIIDFPFSTFPIFLGLAIYSFEGIGLVLPIYNNMKKRSSVKFVVILALGLYTFMMLFFGILGYLSYGKKTYDVITKNMSDYPIPVYIINGCLIITLFFTYPIQLFPIPELFESYTNRIRYFNNFLFKILIRSFLVFGTILGAIFGQLFGFGIVLSFIGAIGGSSLAFTLPGLIHLVTFWPKSNIFTKLKDISLVLFGIGCLLLSVSTNIYSIIVESREETTM